MISLEMDDYHRTAQSLQTKLIDSEEECRKGFEKIQELEEKINSLNEEIGKLILQS